MKYYTLQWWAGEIDDLHGAFVGYRSYLDTIVDKLPDELRRLLKTVSLHDARLRIFNFDASSENLILELDGLRFDETQRTHLGRKFRLTYKTVRSITSLADPDAGLAGPHGYGDLGYDELEIISPGLYEHRMLFSTGIELQVRFSDFTFWYEDKV